MRMRSSGNDRTCKGWRQPRFLAGFQTQVSTTVANPLHDHHQVTRPAVSSGYHSSDSVRHSRLSRWLRSHLFRLVIRFV